MSTTSWFTNASKNRALMLGLTSLLLLGLYSIIALRYPLEPSLADPRATWVSLTEGNLINFSIHLAVYIALFLLYAVTLIFLANPNPDQAADNDNQSASQRWVIGVIVLAWFVSSLVLMTSASAGESHDIYDYTFRGRMMVEYEGNPLVDIPKSYRETAYYRYLAWHSNVDTYGPIWELTSAGIAIGVHKFSELIDWDVQGLPTCPKSIESCDLLIAYMTGYRILAIVLTGVAGALIASMVRRSQVLLVPAALVAWLWNPLTLFASAVGGHNDMLMIVLFLASLWLMQRERPFFALVCLILAAHVKLTPLIWMPLFALWIWRKWGLCRSIITLAGSLAGSLILSWLLYLPYGGWSSLPGMLDERARYLANSIWQVVYTYLYKQQGWQKDDVLRLTAEIPTWVFIGAAVLLSLWLLNFRPKRWRLSKEQTKGDDRWLWAAVCGISLLYLLIGAFWFQHWYVLWVLAPAALLPVSSLTRFFLPWLSFGGLSANFVQGFLLENVPQGAPRTGVYLVTVAIIWGPALVAAILIYLRRRMQSEP